MQMLKFRKQLSNVKDRVNLNDVLVLGSALQCNKNGIPQQNNKTGYTPETL